MEKQSSRGWIQCHYRKSITTIQVCHRVSDLHEKFPVKKTENSEEWVMTTFPAVSHLEDSQSLTFDKIQLLQEVSNTAYNSEFHVYIKIKILAVRMNVIMGMQIKKSERHSNSTLDWRCQGADKWDKCRVNFELKKKTDLPTSKPLNKPLWVTTEPAVLNWQDAGFPSVFHSP